MILDLRNCYFQDGNKTKMMLLKRPPKDYYGGTLYSKNVEHVMKQLIHFQCKIWCFIGLGLSYTENLKKKNNNCHTKAKMAMGREK